MRVISALVVATGIALAALPVRADDAARKSDPRAAFAESDLNRDGSIDRGEFHERMVEVFYAADVNKDGFLDPTELKRLAFPEDFTEDDKDRDGRVAMREFLRVRFHDFDVADANHDGELSREEVVAAYEGKKHR
jgi:Ca2+-binding EF-hand superfamily protein